MLIAIFTLGTMVTFVADGSNYRQQELKNKPEDYSYPMLGDLYITAISAASFALLEIFRPIVYRTVAPLCKIQDDEKLKHIKVTRMTDFFLQINVLYRFDNLGVLDYER
jgi:hypothetical protein